MEFVNVGIDLAIVGNHWAAVLDSKGEVLAAPFAVGRDKRGLDYLWKRVREVTPEGVGVRVVLEPTGWAWLPVAVYLAKKGAVIVRPSTSETASLRRFYRRHAKSDRIDARVLARLPLIKPESLPVIGLPHPKVQALWRFCKQRQRLVSQATSVKGRVRSMVETALPGLSTVFANPVGPAARAIYRDYLNPWRAREAGPAALQQCLVGHLAHREVKSADALSRAVLRVAEEAIAVYGAGEGDAPLGLDHDLLQAELRIELNVLEALESQIEKVESLIEELYHELHPEDYLRTIPGIGRHGAPVFLSGIGDPQRFSSPRQFRSYGGMVPRARASGTLEAKGTSLTKAGQGLLRMHSVLAADVARRYDPQIAAFYYDQMVNKGKHHYQALCACAGKIMSRALKVVQDSRPYRLLDPEGQPIAWKDAQKLIKERYQVPAELRRSRRSHRPSAWGHARSSLAQKLHQETAVVGPPPGLPPTVSPLATEA